MTALIGSAVAVVVVAGIIAGLAFALRNAERSTADARVDAARLEGQLAIATADIATWKATAAAEKRRGDAFDDLLDQVALNGDTDGARARVLARMREVPEADDAGTAATGDGEVFGVPDPGTAGVARGPGPSVVVGG